MSTTANTAHFRLGKTLMTRGAQGALEEAGQAPHEFLQMHERGDWGEVSDDDRQENELSVKEGFRILSTYCTSKGKRIWVITVRHEAHKWNERTVEQSISSSVACPSIATSRWGEA